MLLYLYTTPERMWMLFVTVTCDKCAWDPWVLKVVHCCFGGHSGNMWYIQWIAQHGQTCSGLLFLSQTNTHTHTHTHVCVCMHKHMSPVCTPQHAHTHTHMRRCIHTHTSTACNPQHADTHTCTHTHTHTLSLYSSLSFTHTHTHTHTHTLSLPPRPVSFSVIFLVSDDHCADISSISPFQPLCPCTCRITPAKELSASSLFFILQQFSKRKNTTC